MFDDLISIIIGVIIAMVLFVAGYAMYRQANSPTITIYKNEWQCSKSKQVPVTTFIQSGQVLVPITSYSTECAQYTRTGE